jgi:DNA (cytosine-5)-methyltransferase 1
MLRNSGVLYVIENIAGSTLVQPFMLCGSSFGLDVRRHRFFEASVDVGTLPLCAHRTQRPRFAPATNRTNLRSTVKIGVWRIPLHVQQAAMGIDWMELTELSQAIPPAYAELIARRAPRSINKNVRTLWRGPIGHGGGTVGHITSYIMSAD